jgi:hypothetical protein
MNIYNPQMYDESKTARKQKGNQSGRVFYIILIGLAISGCLILALSLLVPHKTGTVISVTFDFPQLSHDLVYDTALTCIDLCRFDRSSPESEESLAEEETSESSADDSSLWDLFLQEADQNEDRSKKRGGEEDDTQVNASTFSDALMSILPMEKNQADRISKVWDSLSIGQAVYLQGVKEDDDSVLLAARAENGMDFYLTIRKEDYELIRISVGSEYGSTVFG